MEKNLNVPFKIYHVTAEQKKFSSFQVCTDTNWLLEAIKKQFCCCDVILAQFLRKLTTKMTKTVNTLHEPTFQVQ